MPLYEFRCAACQHDFEMRTPTMAVPKELSCPQCGSQEVRRRLSTFFAHSGQKASLPERPASCGECPGGGPSCPFSQ